MCSLELYHECDSRKRRMSASLKTRPYCQNTRPRSSVRSAIDNAAMSGGAIDLRAKSKFSQSFTARYSSCAWAMEKVETKTSNRSGRSKLAKLEGDFID